MISFHDVTYRYPGASAPMILNGVQFTIRTGEYVVICGASGSGKSTLAYLLNGLIPCFMGGEVGGVIRVNGRDPTLGPVADFIDQVGLVFQNSDAQLFNSTVGEEIAYGLESLGMPWGDIKERVAGTASKLGLGHFLSRSPFELSGGEKRLVALASVLVMAPAVVVVDEPFAHLDAAGASRVKGVLQRIHSGGGTVVVVEQRLETALADADHCLILEEGRIVFDGTPAAAGPELRRRSLIPCYPDRRGGRAEAGDPLLTVEDLRFEIHGKFILKGVSFSVCRGEILALVGGNGAGKTTLVRHLNGLIRARKGAVRIDGQDVAAADVSRWAQRVGVVFQNPNDQFFKNQVREELLAGPKALGRRDPDRMAEVIRAFELQTLLDSPPYRLSEGQKKRVALASVLAMAPELLVLDEPTVGQDGRFLETLAGLLLDVRRTGVTILLVTHDVQFAVAVADRWIEMENGRLTGQGAVAEWTMGELRECGSCPAPRVGA